MFNRDNSAELDFIFTKVTPLIVKQEFMNRDNPRRKFAIGFVNQTNQLAGGIIFMNKGQFKELKKQLNSFDIDKEFGKDDD